MDKKICIAIDAMGGENAPSKNIEGINLFSKKNKNTNDYFFNIFGDEQKINGELKKYNISNRTYKIFHTSSVVSDNETPLTAVKTSKNSSMWNSIYSQVKSESDISLSAGNTGVLLVISRMILKTINGVSKPALAGLWPNFKGMNIVLDLGANIECDEKNLVQFAFMGQAFANIVMGIKDPSVSLLNIGEEEQKGLDYIKEASKILYSLDKQINYKGFIEGDKIAQGIADVIIADGFSGNISLKTAEGTALLVTSYLKKALKSSLSSKIGYLFAKKAINNFRLQMDPRKYNGAVFLGLNGIAVKSHGGTDSFGFANAIGVAVDMVRYNFISNLKNKISKIEYRL